MLLRAAGVYFGIVFAVAFGLGALRVLVVVPLFGPLFAVALELPLVVAVSWATAGWVLRRWPLGLGERVVMGALAFGVLMGAEAGLAVLAFGQSFRAFMDGMATPAGALGLAGQIGFAIIPALRRQASGCAVSTRRAKKLAPTGEASSLKS